MVYIAFGLLTVLALAIVYKTVLSPPRRSPYESFEDAAAIPKKADSKIVFMYMTGCGWCEKMRPHWDSFKTTNADRLRALGVTAAAYERSDPAAAALKEHVDGYPTVLFVASDGKTVTKFEGERTPEGLLAFVEKNASAPAAPAGATREGFFFDGGSEGKAITSGIAAADSSVFKKAVEDIKARAGARFGKP
jgi:thioredoxin-related protein